MNELLNTLALGATILTLIAAGCVIAMIVIVIVGER